ncbi:MAG: hypothetical protein N2645_24225, partial [Clostridia bacterium]|nr:hypothetical protein [Clostridia bacterium]
MKKGMGFTLVIALLCLCLGSITVMAEGIGSWTTKAPMPTERGYLEAAVVNGIIYTFGGYNQNSYSAAVEAFNPLTNTWVGKAGMTSARAYFGAAEVSGKIYVLGGIGIQGGYLSLVEEYDPAKNLWTKKAPMLTARDAHAAVACNGKIYIIGGNGQSGILSSVEEYNPATNLWTTKASIPKESQGLRAATVNGKIYVFGGRDNSGITQVVYEYNPITDLWLNKTSMPVKKEKFAVEVLDSKIYIIGGNDANMLSSVEEYDPTTNTWSTKESMQKEVSCLTAGQANGKIYAIGGHTGYNWTGETQEYTLAKSTKPNAPNNLKTNLRMQRLNLGWEPVTGATSYNVKRATTSGGPYTTISSNLTDTAYTDTSVVTNTTYYYVVSAVNSAGESANSNEVSAMFTDQSIIPNLITDKEKYIQDDIVPLSLILTNAQAGDKTNSVTFEVEYDSSTFELANTDPNVSVANGYIPFDTKLSLGTGTTKTVHITYLNMDNDIPL